jgi:hypothetical protein
MAKHISAKNPSLVIMEKLCPVDVQTTFSPDDFPVPLPQIDKEQLRKQRKKILPVLADEDIVYPKIAPGDMIQATKETGDTYIYLIIQRINEQFITYRLDETAPQRYDFFENNLSIVSLCTELDTIIFHDPLNLRSETSPKGSQSNLQNDQTTHLSSPDSC